MKTLIYYFAEKPKLLFLIDSIGAFMTAFFLFAIMRQFNEYFGMSQSILANLSIIAVGFGSYSATCFLLLKKRWTPFLRLIGIANLLYCALTTTLLINYFSLLTILGVMSFVTEIVIICILSYIELNVAKKIY